MRRPDYVSDVLSARSQIEEKAVRELLVRLQRHKS
jgi:hypothetical protein